MKIKFLTIEKIIHKLPETSDLQKLLTYQDMYINKLMYFVPFPTITHNLFVVLLFLLRVNPNLTLRFLSISYDVKTSPRWRFLGSLKQQIHASFHFQLASSLLFGLVFNLFVKGDPHFWGIVPKH